jgi:hypothetical protein
MRGQNRDGISRKTGVIDRWALNGENFLLCFCSGLRPSSRRGVTATGTHRRFA